MNPSLLNRFTKETTAPKLFWLTGCEYDESAEEAIMSTGVFAESVVI